MLLHDSAHPDRLGRHRPSARAHDTTPADSSPPAPNAAAYLGLGYRLLRLREKFAVPEIDLNPPSPTATGY